MTMRIFRFALSCLFFVPFLACSSTTNPTAEDTGTDQSTLPKDIGPAKDGSSPDGGGKYPPCDTPGAFCDAKNPCAINPRCGADKLCRPTKLQDCDDGLDCTIDTCGGLGRCINDPRPDTCAIFIKDASGQSTLTCFKKGDTSADDPCQVCMPDGKDPLTAKQWSPADSGVCDDGDPCTKDDWCKAGVCAGNDYSKDCPDDGNYCTTLCDGQGGCLTGNPILLPNTCFVDKQCLSANTRRVVQGECSICDPTKATDKLTALADTCGIDGKCVDDGEKHPDGCAKCDVKVDRTKWTHDATSNACLIERSCIPKGQRDASGCLECDPSRAPTEWSKVAGSKEIVYDFDAAGTLPSGFSQTPIQAGSVTPVAWQVRSDGRSTSGQNALYYGNPAANNGKGNYESFNDQTPPQPVPNGGELFLPAVTLPAGQKATMTFKIFMAIEEKATSDRLARELKSGDVLWVKDDVKATHFFSWYEVSFDLSKYAGQTIEPKFIFYTGDSYDNTTEGIYVVTVQGYEALEIMEKTKGPNGDTSAAKRLCGAPRSADSGVGPRNHLLISGRGEELPP
jgi:hypothetical protein